MGVHEASSSAPGIRSLPALSTDSLGEGRPVTGSVSRPETRAWKFLYSLSNTAPFRRSWLAMVVLKPASYDQTVSGSYSVDSATELARPLKPPDLKPFATRA